jgi:hypothetical protein
MIPPRALLPLATALLALSVISLTGAPSARGDAASCARTTSASTPLTPSPGNPCWTDVLPYPFGSDGNPADPSSSLCARPGPAYGPGWRGDFNSNGNGIPGAPPCYLTAQSMAFRAWNRGLAALAQPRLGHGSNPSNVPYGLWLYNGTTWFPDPTFPGASVCPGSEVLWAGKLDYWLIGPNVAGDAVSPSRTLCRFDGINLQWEPLSLPAGTVARLPVDSLTGSPAGGITSGACYAWNDCWFFGEDGIAVHWDGQTLSDASMGVATSPWLQGDFSGAVAGTDPVGHPFGLAVTKSSNRVYPNGLPRTPDGSPPVQLFGSGGGPWEPLPFSPPAGGQPGDPFTTDLIAIGANSQGDVWIAGDPADRLAAAHVASPQPAPLERLTEPGAPAACSGYAGTTFTLTPSVGDGYRWRALSVFPDGSALAGAWYSNTAVRFQIGTAILADSEPILVRATCARPPDVTQFRIPDPFSADPAHALAGPADMGGWVTTVGANAVNDGWAATTDGAWRYFGNGQQDFGGFLRPHLYRWTDGQPPAAPTADDSESRPSLFTLDPPVYQIGSPTIVVIPSGQKTVQTRGRNKKVKLPPAIYSIHSKLRHSPNGTFTLALSFKVRRPVTVGLQALRGRTVVASSGMKRFTGHSGALSVTLDRKRWPTRLRLVTSGAKK